MERVMNGVDIYKEHTVSTQSKGRLIVMLYEGAIKFLKIAIKELDAGNFGEKGKYINKALDIINELNAVLDVDSGGEVATNLRNLYQFMTRRLNEANIQKDANMIRDVIKLLEELNQSWKAVAG
jgi:flagellar secretion chaperone FliS